MMKPGIRLAGICLHINTVLNALIAFTALAIIFYIPDIAENDPVGLTVMLVVMPSALLIAGGNELVAWGLRRGHAWSWYAGLIIFIVLLVPPFLPLGIVGLWGLLHNNTRQAFTADR